MRQIEISDHDLTRAQADDLLVKAGEATSALRDYVSLTDAQLRAQRGLGAGRYIAESLKVLEVALSLGHRPCSILTSSKWLPALAGLEERFPAQLNECLTLVATGQQLRTLTGYHVHRGTLASLTRPQEQTLSQLTQTGRPLVVLEDIVDHSNLGAICRAVVGLGAGGLILSPRCADPLYRRSIRVSMGASLRMAWARAQSWEGLVEALRVADYTLIALSVSEQSRSLRALASEAPSQVAILLGSEGPGLSRQALLSADQQLYIPMSSGVESLNIASAAAVAMWALAPQG